MSYQEAYQEPYTKYPNRYNDIIKPRLTGTQRDICDVVIRMTWGWHEESAEISNTVFARKANKSKQGIIKAKKQLEEMGVLIVLGKGGGSKTNEYMLDLWYDNPDRSIKASRIRQEEMVAVSKQWESLLDVTEETESIPEHLEIPTPHESDISQEIQHVEMEVPAYEDTVESQPVEPEELSEHDEMEIPTHDEDVVLAVEISPASHTEISDTPEPINPVSAEDSDPPTSKLSLPPSYIKSINSINEERKQTEDSEEEKAERKEATAAVCSLLRSWGTELEQKDYSFVGWSLKTYGVDVVQQKIEIMRLQRNRGVTFSNPLGWLRSALSRDYGFCRWDSEVLKAKVKARRETERSELEQMQKEREIQKAEMLKNEAEKMKAQLSPKDREDLRKAAIEKISGMGIASNWINEPLIESVENEILRNGSSR